VDIEEEKVTGQHIRQVRARIVVLGYRQKKGVDYQDLFEPVAKKTSLLTFLHMLASEDLECDVLDFTTAFLNGVLHEDISIEAPSHFGIPGKALKLNKALYGLKQAPRE
jgi:hypothetical protein